MRNETKTEGSSGADERGTPVHSRVSGCLGGCCSQFTVWRSSNCFFVPLARFRETGPARGFPGLIFPDVIPSVKMSELYDDIGRFWTRHTHDRDYSVRYVEIAEENGKIIVKRTGHLHQDFGVNKWVSGADRRSRKSLRWYHWVSFTLSSRTSPRAGD
jgi:hypothetical protein